MADVTAKNEAAQKRFLMRRELPQYFLSRAQECEQFSGAVDPTQIVHHLLTTADKYRQSAQRIGDHETVRRILALTDELKQRARDMANPNLRPPTEAGLRAEE